MLVKNLSWHSECIASNGDYTVTISHYVVLALLCLKGSLWKVERRVLIGAHVADDLVCRWKSRMRTVLHFLYCIMGNVHGVVREPDATH